MSDPIRTGDRPAVVPRAGRRGSDARLPVQQLVLAAVARGGRRGVVVIAGPAGSGKTTALRHLRATLPADAVMLFDAHETAAARQASTGRLVVLAAVRPAGVVDPLDVLLLRPWDRDDCLEYLAAVHRAACGSVLGRLTADASIGLLGGSPQLLALVMDAMAADHDVRSARDVLRRHAGAVVPPGAGLDRLARDGPAHVPLDLEQWRWWRHDVFQRVCRADWVAAQLAVGEVPTASLPPADDVDTVTELAAAVRLRPAAIAHLQRRVAAEPRSAVTPVAASVLLAVDPAWRPVDGRRMNLAAARLSGANWAGLDLSGVILTGADLRGANLSGANLTDAQAEGSDLTGADLRGARLSAAKLTSATLRSARLGGAVLAKADLTSACLADADLTGADCTLAWFADADLADAAATAADFTAAFLSRVEWAGADFGSANFGQARFTDVDLAGAEWGGARFAAAVFLECRLEGLDLPGADFTAADLTGALLTGSRMPGAHFRGAVLRHAGLAEVDWPSVDLREADLTGASFHLGSTRSGLVGSTVPMEGSMTGFYTDDAVDRSYKQPEEIRKANLCGADLTGSIVDRTDFYLVDLRRATYSAEQGEHLARTGAILR